MIITGASLLSYAFLRAGSLPRIQKSHIPLFAYIAITGTCVRYLLRYWGLFHIPVTKVALFLNLTPFTIAILGWGFCHKKLSRIQWAALFSAIIGIMPIILIQESCSGAGSFSCIYLSLPELAIIAAMFLYSGSVLAMQSLIRNHNYPATFVYAVSMAGGGLVGIGMLAFSSESSTVVTDPYAFGLLLAILIVVTNFICSPLYYGLLNNHSATFLALTDCLGPLFVGIYSAFLFGDTFSWHYPASALIVGGSLYLFYRDELFKD